MAPKYKLTYYPSMALAEPVRYVLAYGGVEFEDFRFDREDWPALKPTMPFGKVPVLEIDGKVIHQSTAICRYLGKKFEIAGANDLEELQCDMMVESVIDLRTEVNFYYHEKDEKRRQEMREKLVKETIPFYMKRLDAEVEKNSGHVVGGKLTWADLYIVGTFDFLQAFLKLRFLDDGTYSHMKDLKEKVTSLPAIKSWIERRPKTEL